MVLFWTWNSDAEEHERSRMNVVHSLHCMPQSSEVSTGNNIDRCPFLVLIRDCESDLCVGVES